MITIHSYDEVIIIEGHAKYAKHGKDIVCAAVSALAQTFVASVEELTDDEIIYTMEPGKMVIKHGNLSKIAQSLRDSFFIGATMIVDAYPSHVCIKRY